MWNDAKVVAVDLRVSAKSRESFSQAIHRKSVTTIKAYWQQQIFSGRETPPVEKASDAEVLAFVRTNPNAIGYVSSTAALGAGVKELQVVN